VESERPSACLSQRDPGPLFLSASTARKVNCLPPGLPSGPSGRYFIKECREASADPIEKEIFKPVVKRARFLAGGIPWVGNAFFAVPSDRSRAGTARTSLGSNWVSWACRRSSAIAAGLGPWPCGRGRVGRPIASQARQIIWTKAARAERGSLFARRRPFRI